MMPSNTVFRPMDARMPLETRQWARWEGAALPATPRGPSLVARAAAWWTRHRSARALRMAHARAPNETPPSGPARPG